MTRDEKSCQMLKQLFVVFRHSIKLYYKIRNTLLFTTFLFYNFKIYTVLHMFRQLLFWVNPSTLTDVHGDEAKKKNGKNQNG